VLDQFVHRGVMAVMVNALIALGIVAVSVFAIIGIVTVVVHFIWFKDLD
jgi:hypothetical protein